MDVGNGEAGHRIDGLAGNVQRLAGGRQHPQLRRRPQQRRRQLGTGRDQVLAVVDDQQHLAVLRVLHQRLDDRAPRLLLHAEHRRDRLRHEPRVRHRRELDEPDAVGVVVDDLGADLQRQSRLADAAGAGQRQQPRRREESADLGELALAPDERGDLERQVVRRGLQRAQRREVPAQLRMHELVDALRIGEAAQAHGADVAQRDAVRQAVADELGRRLRDQHLPAVGGGHDPRGAVDRRAVPVVVAVLRGADVQAAAHLQRDAVLVPEAGERALQRDRRLERVDRIGEDRVDAVAGRLHDRAAMALDGGARERVVLGQRRRHPLRLRLPQPGARLDVGEEGGDDFGAAARVHCPPGAVATDGAVIRAPSARSRRRGAARATPGR